MAEDRRVIHERVVERLRRYREAWDAGGVGALRALPAISADSIGYARALDDPEQRGELYEVLGYDALTFDRPGWAYVCLRAATDQYALAGTLPQLQRVREAAREVLRSTYPPYEDDEEMLEDVRRWARERIGELGPLVEPVEATAREMSATTALKHRWSFRVLRTRQDGRLLPFDALMEQFALHPEDRVLLRVLVALYWDAAFTHAKVAAGYDHGPLTLGQLVDLVSEDLRGRPAWVARFDPRNPLVRWDLARVGGEGALHGRTVEPDESILAWLHGYDAWPLSLRDVARVRYPEEQGVPTYAEGALALLDRVRRKRDEAPVHVVLATPSSAASRWLVDVWAGARHGAVIEVGTLDLAPAQMRAVGREARLRGAVVFVPREVGIDVRRLAAIAETRLLVDVPGERFGLAATHLERAVTVELPAPAREVRAPLWNETLIAEGLAELSPAALDEHLGPYAVHPPEMARLVTRAADRAWLQHSGAGQVRVDAGLLRQLIEADPELAGRAEVRPDVPS